MIFVPAFGQTSVTNPQANQTVSTQQGTNQVNTSILVSTDKSSYGQGDTIVVSGHVNPVASNTGVVIRLFNSQKNMISIGELTSSDGTFTKTFVATGPLWQYPGTYTVVAQYGLYSTNATFYYNGGDGSSSVSKFINSTYTLQVGNQTYSIQYIIKGGTVSSMNILAPQYAFEITVNTNSDGSITVTLPRNLIDAKFNSDQDASFIVTVNGKQVTQFTETKNQNMRILSIQFHNGDSKIDITGTRVNVGSISSSSVPLQIPATAPLKIPGWIKHVFISYGQGQVSEDELLNALKFLIQQGILKIQ